MLGNPAALRGCCQLGQELGEPFATLELQEQSHGRVLLCHSPCHPRCRRGQRALLAGTAGVTLPCCWKKKAATDRFCKACTFCSSYPPALAVCRRVLGEEKGQECPSRRIAPTQLEAC